jgi:protein ImuB
MGWTAMTKPAEFYACLYADEFPVQALLRLRPELREQPCVVMEGIPPLQQACSLNAKACRLGIAQGMTKVEVDTFSRVNILPRSQKEETATKMALLECAGAFSPRIEDRSEDTAFLCVIDIAGTEKLFGSPEVLAKKLLDRVRVLGIKARIAVSNNFHAAIALAKGMPSRTAVQIIPTGEECDVLASLPLSVLDLPEEQAETFSLWGIRTVGMLADLPEKELIARRGQAGRRLHQLARGEMPHLFQPIEPAFALEERMELDSPVELLDSLLFVIGVMFEQLILRAQARMLALASVSITLTLEGGTMHTRTVRPALPMNERKTWLKLLHLDLEAHPPQAAILALALTAEPGKTSKVQLGMFTPQLPEPARLDVTLARIRTIVGEENVGRAVLRDTHERDGFRMEPFSIPSGKPSATLPSQSRAAVRQLRPAESISLTLQSERPMTFVFREQRYIVDRAYGPWLTSGAWWNQTLWGWEQWDLVAHAHNSTSLCCCVLRDLARDRWEMAVLYD